MNFCRDEKVILDKVRDGYSIARYGDGEFKMIRDLPITIMQDYHPELTKKLQDVFLKPLDKLMIGIPDVLCDRPFVSGITKQINRYLAGKPAESKSSFISSFITRPSLINKDSQAYFEKIKDVWKGREIVLVNFNPELTDHFLFRDSDCIFLQIPRNNCFFMYNRIFEECKFQFNRDYLFILSAGPVATVLAYDLCKAGEQALDIGAFAFEYSLFKDESPEQWNYQDAYRKGKRGYLKGITDGIK